MIFKRTCLMHDAQNERGMENNSEGNRRLWTEETGEKRRGKVSSWAAAAAACLADPKFHIASGWQTVAYRLTVEPPLKVAHLRDCARKKKKKKNVQAGSRTEIDSHCVVFCFNNFSYYILLATDYCSTYSFLESPLVTLPYTNAYGSLVFFTLATYQHKII
jgi:hypothetical protein